VIPRWICERVMSAKTQFHRKNLPRRAESLNRVPPKMPDGYIPPAIYRWARLDYERVLLEFGALTGLLLVAWMFTYTGGKSNEPK